MGLNRTFGVVPSFSSLARQFLREEKKDSEEDKK
jgi:hypothetical protein